MPPGYKAKTSVARLGCLVLGFAALVAFAGCEGRTTGASDITEQPGGSYSAKLNAVGTCDEGSSRTPCTAYMRWREVGSDAWTESPSTKVDRKIRNRPFSYTVRDLAPNAEYEYQVCGREFSEPVFCAGPDGTSETTEKFVATERPAEEREKVDDEGGDQSGAQGGPASDDSNGSQSAGAGSQGAGTGSQIGGDAGTSPLLPIVIAVGAVGLVIGGAWWARRQAYW
jgi:hypothetical protein